MGSNTVMMSAMEELKDLVREREIIKQKIFVCGYYGSTTHQKQVVGNKNQQLTDMFF